MFHAKEKMLPIGRPSTRISSGSTSPKECGAMIVVSQYGGVVSAAAASYVCQNIID